MSKIKRKEYIAFKCLECEMISVFPSHKADGNRCIECGGCISPIGNARVKRKETNSIKIDIKVDGTKLCRSFYQNSTPP